jgi:hypothetical protein
MPEATLAKPVQRKATFSSPAKATSEAAEWTGLGAVAGMPLFLQRRDQGNKDLFSSYEPAEFTEEQSPVQSKCTECATGGALCPECAEEQKEEAQTQMTAAGTANPQPREAAVHAVARQGVHGADTPLPHFEKIQAAFGHHDVSHARAKVGGTAAEAGVQLGAAGYTVGSRVGFKEPPGIRLAAHEAAHVVQQRRGVSLSGGVGQPGDKYEQQADSVAERVAADESAEGLLDDSGGTPGRAVQAKCDCGGMCSECAGRRWPEEDEDALQMDLQVNASRIFDPIVDSSADATPSLARGGAANRDARPSSGGRGAEAKPIAQGDGSTTDGGGTGAAGVPASSGAGGGSGPQHSSDVGGDGGASASTAAKGTTPGTGGASSDASSSSGGASAGATPTAGSAGAPSSTDGGTGGGGSPAGGGTVTTGGQGACTGGGQARCYSEPSEKPATEPEQTPPNPAPTQVRAETSAGDEEDLPEPDDCPAEQPGAAKSGAPAGTAPVATSAPGTPGSQAGPALSGAKASTAAPEGAAAGGPAPEGRGGSPAATAPGGAADQPSMSFGSPLDAVIASAEAQRGAAVAAYRSSSAALAAASEGTRTLSSGTRFAERPSESSADAIRRRAAAGRADSFFAGVADRLDAAIAAAAEQVPDQLGAAAESAKAQIGASIETQKPAISGRIERARGQARVDAAMARRAVMQQTEAFVADARAQTAGAIESLTTTHRETMGQVNELETGTLDKVNEIYGDGQTDLEALGTTIGGECTAKGEEYANIYSGFRHCTENGFWDGDLSERRSMAQENAARSVAKSYHDRIVESAKKRAREVIKSGRKSDRCSIITSASQSRNTLDDQLSNLTSALETARDAAVQQAGSTRDGLIASIDSSLASTLRQLDRQEHDQRQAADDTGYLQQVLQEQIAHAAAAAVQRGVQMAVASAQSALSAVQAQCAANNPPDSAALDGALLQVEQNINTALSGLRGSVEGGAAAAETQLAEAAQQGLGALDGVTQSNDELAGTVGGEFTSAMSVIAGSDNFASQRSGFTQQIQQSTAAGSAALSQALGGMRRGCDAATQSARTTLAQAHTDLEQKLRQSKQGLECEITRQADEAASHEAPAWKMLVAIVLVIIVVVIVIAVIVASGGAAMAALVAAAGPIGAAILVGAAVGAVTSGLLAVASNLWNNRSWSQGVLKAVAIGAITGAIGGGIGAAAGLGAGVLVQGASKAVQVAAQLGAAMVTAGGLDVVTQYVLGGFKFDHFSWTSLGITLVVTALTFGLGHKVSARVAAARAARARVPEPPVPGVHPPEPPVPVARPTEAPVPSAPGTEPPTPATHPAEPPTPAAHPAEPPTPAAHPGEPPTPAAPEAAPPVTPHEEAPPVVAPREEAPPAAPPHEEVPPTTTPREEAPPPGTPEGEPAATPARSVSQRGYDGPWPPPEPQGRKPGFGEPNAFEWRYQRYLRQQYEAGVPSSEVLTPDAYRNGPFRAASTGGRPGRSGGQPQQTTRKSLAANEGVTSTETKQLGTRVEDGKVKANMVDGVQPVEGQPGKNNYFEVDDILSNGLPRADMRAKLKAELPHLTEGESLVYVDKNDPTRRITYRAGEDPGVVDTRRAPQLPRRPRAR